MTPDASPLSLLRNGAANFANTNGTAGTLRSIAASFVKTAIGDIDDSQDGDDNNRTQGHRCNDEVAKWARIECKSYKVDGGFTVER
jgi:hypothetical protein